MSYTASALTNKLGQNVNINMPVHSTHVVVTAWQLTAINRRYTTHPARAPRDWPAVLQLHRDKHNLLRTPLPPLFQPCLIIASSHNRFFYADCRSSRASNNGFEYDLNMTLNMIEWERIHLI